MPVSNAPGNAGPQAPTASQEVQRAALEQSSGIRPEASRNPSARSVGEHDRDNTTPPSRTAQSPSTPSQKNVATPSVRGQNRTIKVANSPALRALYSPTLSPLAAVSGERVSTPGAGPGSSSLNAANEASVALAKLEASIEKEVDRIEREIWLWGPACHAVWGLWGIVFAKEEIEQLLKNALDPDAEAAAEKNKPKAQADGEGGDVDTFDYLRYALGRIELFREETASMNIQPKVT
ncbi:unnamed protein product [Tilletia controversa]|nr:unnamed protein product [Tilletia controversa]